MKKNTNPFPIILIITCVLFSCKGRMYKAGSHSMADTIVPGETFYVSPSVDYQKNDIVVFDHYCNDYTSPPDENGQFKKHWEKRIYRVMAVSGDSIQIVNDEVIVNGRPVPFPLGAKLPYRLCAKVSIDDLNDNEYFEPLLEQAGDTMVYHVLLSKEKAAAYRARKPAIIKVERENFEPSVADSLYAMPAANLGWSTANYGPLKIPAEGETVLVTDENFKLYQSIPGIQKGKFKITGKLYFLLGDNRHLSEDSRFTGFISHSNMYGIVK